MRDVASVCRGWKAVPVSHLRHPPALWQDPSAQPLCTALFNSFRCLSSGSCAHPWDCCFHGTPAHCPEHSVGTALCCFFLLAPMPSPSWLCLLCHYAWEYFHSCPSPSSGSCFLFFSPCISPVSESFFPAFSSPEGGWCICGFIAVPVPEVKRQPWGNPSAGFAAPLDTHWMWRTVLAEITACHGPSCLSLGPQTPLWRGGPARGQQIPASNHVPQETSKPSCLTYDFPFKKRVLILALNLWRRETSHFECKWC